MENIYNALLLQLLFFPLELFSRAWKGLSTVLNMYFFLSCDPPKKLAFKVGKALHAYLDYTCVYNVYTL